MRSVPFLIVATVTGLAAAGCDSPTALAGHGALEADVAVSQSPLPAGDTVSITVTAHNRTTQPIQLPAAPCVALGFAVLGPDGAVVATSAPDCAVLGGDAEDVIPPGGSLSVVHQWAAVEGYGTVGGSGAPLPPGSYTVVATIGPGPLGAGGEERATVALPIVEE
jgi:hypothetical protein